MMKVIELQVNGEGRDVAAWRWRHMKINGQRQMVPMSNKSRW